MLSRYELALGGWQVFKLHSDVLSVSNVLEHVYITSMTHVNPIHKVITVMRMRTTAMFVQYLHTRWYISEKQVILLQCLTPSMHKSCTWNILLRTANILDWRRAVARDEWVNDVKRRSEDLSALLPFAQAKSLPYNFIFLLRNIE